MNYLIDKFISHFRCLLGWHEFYSWECRTDVSDPLNARFWYERECANCPRVERKDFR